jgi:hypothetical protein
VKALESAYDDPQYDEATCNLIIFWNVCVRPILKELRENWARCEKEGLNICTSFHASGKRKY